MARPTFRRRDSKGSSNDAIGILIVTEDESCGGTCKGVLKEDGYRVNVATSIPEALQAVRNEVYDIILVDLNLSGLDGLEFQTQLMDQVPGVQIILMTTYTSLNKAVRGIGEGAYDYLSKPFLLEELRVIIKNTVDRVMLLKENKVLVELLKGGSLPARQDHIEFIKKQIETEEKEEDIQLIHKLRTELLDIYNKIGSTGSN